METTYPQPRARLFITLSVVGVLIFGWLVRAQATFGTALIPGINGAYYPVQVRSILTSGSLGLPDFPLLFYLEAGIAKLIAIFQPLEEAIMTATRWTDTLGPVFLVIPVALFAYEFRSREKKSYAPILATVLVGLIAVGNTSLLRMAGDFQKNAFGLPLSLTFFYFLYRSLEHHNWRDYALAGLFFALTCSTHIGVAAMTLTVTGLAALIALIKHPNRKKALVIVGGLALVLVVVLGIVYLYDPVRISRLLKAHVSAGELFANSTLNRLLDGRSNPGGLQLPNLNELVLGNGLGILGIAICLIFRKHLTPGQRNLLWASSLASLFLASPLIGGEWAHRLALMAFVPGLIPLTYLTASRGNGWAFVWPITVLVLSSTLTSASRMNKHALTEAAYQELVSFKEQLQEENTLIVAAHGLEWWVAWAMDTDISNRFELAIENWDEYTAIYILEQTNAAAFPGNRFSAPTSSKPTSPNNAPGGINQPAPKNTNRTFGIGLDQSNLEVILSGEFFTLSRVVSKPLLIQGSGPPDLQGELEALQEDRVTILGVTVYFDETTVVTRDGAPIKIDELSASEVVVVWGEWGLLGNTLTADYVLAGQPRFAGQPNLPTTDPSSPENPPGKDPKAQSVPFGPLTMITRAGWGAKPPNPNSSGEGGPFDPETNPTGVFRYPQPLKDWLNTVVVHHSALPGTQGPLEIQALHMGQRGYSDIGYHFLIDPDGTLYEGRPLNMRGAHVEGYNTGSV